MLGVMGKTCLFFNIVVFICKMGFVVCQLLFMNLFMQIQGMCYFLVVVKCALLPLILVHMEGRFGI